MKCVEPGGALYARKLAKVTANVRLREEEHMAENFTEEPKAQKIAEAYAQDAIDFAANQFKITLDWSDSSISQIETVLGKMHESAINDKPTEEQIYQFAKMFGSYVGEVYRRNHRATWGIITLNDQKMPGLRTSQKGTLFWPWGRANNRIVNGEEDNIWHYYQTLVTENNPENAAPLSGSPSSSEKLPWWKLWK